MTRLAAGAMLRDSAVRALEPAAATLVTPRPGRAELKFCVPADMARRVLAVASQFLAPDRRTRAGRVQRVTSLYFDSERFTFLQWHREREDDRFKLRIRTYGDGPHLSFFAEVKHKRRGIVTKTRAEVPAHIVGSLVAGDFPDSGSLSRENARALRNFVARTLAHGAEPRILVSYLRESLRSPSGDETALTVDRSVAYRPSRVFDSTATWLPVTLAPDAGPDAVLLELKFGLRLPSWMAPVVRRLAPWNVSFSKYESAMSHLSTWEARP